MKRSLAYAALAATAVAACSVQNTDQVEIALTAAEKAATNYVRLPLCTGANGPICSDKAISDKIKLAAQTAHDAFKAWQANPSNTNEAAMMSAVAAFNAVVPSLAAPAKP